MITGFDHLALTADDFSSDDQILRESGYKQTFYHADIPNPTNKRDLMHRWSETHTLAMYERVPGVPIELIDYGHLRGGDTRYFPMNHSLCEGLELAVSEEVLDTFDSTAGEIDQDLFSVGAKTGDPSASRDFWRVLGFERIDDRRLVFKPPLGTGLEIVLIEDDCHGKKTSLDTSGCPCVAFVTSSMENELRRFESQGYETGPIDSIKFPEKTLQVSFLIGPSGEPVELVAPITE
jgi:hypothetical protein